MRILLASPLTPYLPCHDGVRSVVAHLVRTLAGRHAVGLVAGAGPAETPAHRRWAAAVCEWTELVDVARWLHPVTGAPADGMTRFREAMLRAIERFKPDVLQLEGGVLAPLARLGGVPTLLSIHDARPGRARELGRPHGGLWSRLAERRQTAWARRWYGAADARVTPSDDDRAIVDAVSPGRVTDVVLPGVDVTHCEFRRGGQPARLLFTGDLAWTPHADAACRLATGVWPAVRARRPGAELVLAGADPAAAVRALAARPGVRVVGAVSDLRPTIWNAAVHVGPDRLLEAMALGTPVITSSSAAARIAGAVPGEHLLVADDAAAMVEAIVTLFADADTADSLARRARALIEHHYGWADVAERYERLLARIAHSEGASTSSEGGSAPLPSLPPEDCAGEAGARNVA